MPLPPLTLPPLSPFSAPCPAEGVDLLVPHSLSLENGLLCVADREHGRVICWNVRQPLLQPQVINLALYGRIYAVSITGQTRDLGTKLITEWA